MFNNPRIHLFNKLLCLLLYSLVIIFNSSSFALLYIFDVTIWVKLILLIAYIYYFMYLDINNLPRKKKEVVTEVKVDKEEIKKNIEEKVEEELEKGNKLTEEEKEKIKSRLDSKIESETKKKQNNYFVRYYYIQQKLSKRKYTFSSDNITFLLVHIILLIVCVVVEFI